MKLSDYAKKKENQSLEVKVKGISEMEFSLSIFDYTFTNYKTSP
ncbi:hypothetical protein NIES3787_30670 [Microcystis aeruginosa NIES-3787]|uniref:Uncharacterized protein n=1 Tax=Microcystis aeruginosa NIES-3787 TaxID=2517782 RepID=A0A6H9FW63_MICAE|nr:hypothetical protein NIES3787_30670 [Microcystis aeruginosa NIES-3787]